MKAPARGLEADICHLRQWKQRCTCQNPRKLQIRGRCMEVCTLWLTRPRDCICVRASSPWIGLRVCTAVSSLTFHFYISCSARQRLTIEVAQWCLRFLQGWVAFLEIEGKFWRSWDELLASCKLHQLYFISKAIVLLLVLSRLSSVFSETKTR